MIKTILQLALSTALVPGIFIWNKARFVKLLN